MSPNCTENSPSTSQSPVAPRFVPSLVCIAEEEPKIVGSRWITVPKGSQVEIPIYDVNIYAPRPKQEPLSESMRRLLAEMDTYIAKSTGGAMEKHKLMAKSLRQKVELERAEKRRLATPNFTDRDWYWYAEQTGNFVDVPINQKSTQLIDNHQMKEEEPVIRSDKEGKIDNSENEDVFDLSADF